MSHFHRCHDPFSSSSVPCPSVSGAVSIKSYMSHLHQTQQPCRAYRFLHTGSYMLLLSHLPLQVSTLTAASDKSSLLTSVGSIASHWCTTCAPQSAPLPAALPPRAQLPRASLTLRTKPVLLHAGCRKSFLDNREQEEKTGRQTCLKSNNGTARHETLAWRTHKKLSSSPCKEQNILASLDLLDAVLFGRTNAVAYCL